MQSLVEVVEPRAVSPLGDARAFAGAGGRLRVQHLPDGQATVECRPNVAMAPRSFTLALCLAAVPPVVVAGGFLGLGLSLVLPFAAIEVLALGTAWIVLTRHATDGETVRIGLDTVELEQRRGRHVSREVFERHGLRSSYRAGADGGRVRLQQGARWAELGGCLRSGARQKLARDLHLLIGRTGPRPVPEPELK